MTLCLLLAASVQSFMPHTPRTLPRVTMHAIDYKDPVVAEEFALIQNLDPDEVGGHVENSSRTNF